MEGLPRKKEILKEVPDHIKYAPIFDKDGNEVLSKEDLPNMPKKVLKGMLSMKDQEYIDSFKQERLDEANAQVRQPQPEVPAANDRYVYERQDLEENKTEDWKTRYEREKEERQDENRKKFA